MIAESSTLHDLVLHLECTKNPSDVVKYVQTKWPKSSITYLSSLKGLWLERNANSEEFLESFAYAEQQTVRLVQEGTVPPDALEKLLKIKELTGSARAKLIRAMKKNCYSGSVAVDRLIKSITLVPVYISDLKPTKDINRKNTERTDESLQQKSDTVWNIHAPRALNQIHKTLMQCTTSNPFDIASAIALGTGRRMVEIFKIGEFALVDGEDITLLFRGSAKRCDESEILDASVEEYYKIPTLVPARLIMAGLLILRKTKDAFGMSNEQVNSTWSNSCNSAARKLLGADRKFGDLRSAYAMVSYEAARHITTLSMNAWAKKRLGHRKFSTITTYTTVRVTGMSKEFHIQWKEESEADMAVVALRKSTSAVAEQDQKVNSTISDVPCSTNNAEVRRTHQNMVDYQTMQTSMQLIIDEQKRMYTELLKQQSNTIDDQKRVYTELLSQKDNLLKRYIESSSDSLRMPKQPRLEGSEAHL